jgi:hypothetical protein
MGAPSPAHERQSLSQYVGVLGSLRLASTSVDETTTSVALTTQSPHLLTSPTHSPCEAWSSQEIAGAPAALAAFGKSSAHF